VFIPLVGCGWMTVRLALQSCLVHTWSHFTEARLRLNRAVPVPIPAIAHAALSFFLGMLPMMISRDKLPARPFIAVMSVGGSGGGDWSVRIADGACTVSEARDGVADIAMTYRDPETLPATARRIQNPMVAMLTGSFACGGCATWERLAKCSPRPRPIRCWSRCLRASTRSGPTPTPNRTGPRPRPPTRRAAIRRAGPNP